MQRTSALYYVNAFHIIPNFIISNVNRSYVSLNKATWMQVIVEQGIFSQCEHGHKMAFVKYLVIKYFHIPSKKEAEVMG